MSFAPINPARYRRRQLVSALLEGLCWIAAALGIVLLGVILFMLVERGLSGLSPTVFTESMRSTGNGRGLANAIVGSLIQAGLGALIGAPLGMAAGIYLAEVGRNSRFATIVRFVNDILLSAPSVLVGLFVYNIMVFPIWMSGQPGATPPGFSGLAGAVALALLAMPVVARTTEDIIRLLPSGYREGSVALGARDNTTIMRVIVPAAFGGILTGILLAVARISGETAPLIFTSLGNDLMSTDVTRAMASVPIAILTYAREPSPESHDLAWTGALIITVGVLVLNVASRFVHRLATKR
jgi:phosphate transport system permease protein